MAETTQAEPKYPRTISQVLFDTWQRLKRKGDPGAMAERFHLSRVPFDNALNWGYCPKGDTVDYVNTFYRERLQNEKDSAAELNELADAVDQNKKP